jgi:hypothetical protein
MDQVIELAIVACFFYFVYIIVQLIETNRLSRK